KAVMTEYGLERTPILWLSRVATEKNAVRPSPPEKVALAVEHFIEVSEHSVVLLDGLEYLVSHNDFGSVLALLHDLNESVAMREAILLGRFDSRTRRSIRRSANLVSSSWISGPSGAVHATASRRSSRTLREPTRRFVSES